MSKSHGHTRGGRSSKLYLVWQNMRFRCQNKTNPNYKHYGARGIKVCTRWESFDNFREDMESSYEKHRVEHGQRNTTLDRVDNGGDYEPSNCRWATWKEQVANTRISRNFEFKGKIQTLTEWSKELGIGYATLYKRFAKGWPVERILDKERHFSRNYQFNGNI